MSDGQEALREPWDSLRRQREAASFGTWLFLGSEALLFGGLMMAFTVNRVLHGDAFAAAGHETNVVYGTVNTLVLLSSSLTMAIGAEAARAELRKPTLIGLSLTILFALTFLVIKGFEWRDDFREGLFPGPGFKLQEPATEIFFAFYWVMTGLHGLHVTAGIAVITWFTWQAWNGKRALRSPAFEAAALYWHLVDIVWVFLYPLLYLGGRA
ncbi:cytochrome c oxidase subunit 3 family protein [Roseomonas sp. KE2513]|uniref:cytochrome c oxidase subunit 3 family protein n=1 Tax=Roseomonas sp. KE2513 TaxID=2479202 RepID=UPI0018DFDDBA|nr:cytochrome c oxidase subunit 3 family protein [Roseomonas sp. KE2513]MBI0534955.1 cytochrome c oxidase subunit 3 family protein [Roseomonas sp. KE2513]